MDYKAINKSSWNRRTEEHYTSKFYDNDTFIKGRSSLNPPELDLLGDIKNKSILHLQCHFGQDTISLSKLGAKATGLDFSDAAIEKAKSLAKIMKTDTQFICSDVYSAPDVLTSQYDRIFTSYGTIVWLPDLDRWANVINSLLKPGGEFVIVDFHPTVWMFDDETVSKVAYSYFKSDAIIDNEGTYTDVENDFKSEVITWNHALSETINALMNQGLKIEAFKEYDYSCYNCMARMKEDEPGKFRLEHMDKKMPLMFGLKVKKDSDE